MHTPPRTLARFTPFVRLMQLVLLILLSIPAAALKAQSDPARQAPTLDLELYHYLPQALAHRKECEKLDLSDQYLAAVPPELAKLKNLKYLNLSNNPIRTLPEWVGKLKKLEKLIINNCQLSQLPASLASLAQLRHLEARQNQIDRLPDSFVQLGQLRHLDLCENKLSGSLALLSGQAQLVILKLNGNPLGQLHLHTVHLDSLLLQGCALRAWPQGLQGNTQLVHLNLSSNQLAEQPNLAGLHSLRTLDVRYNQLTSLDLRDLPGLTELEADHNQLTQITLPTEHLRRLALAHNQLSTLPGSLCDAPLAQLNLSANPLAELPACIGQLSGLQQLYASNCQLATLPEDLSGLRALAQCGLGGNQLATLPGSLLQLPRLLVLDLSQNRLTQLPSLCAAGTLPQLTSLNLSYNQLAALPSCLTDLPRLQLLFVGGNPLATPVGELQARYPRIRILP